MVSIDIKKNKTFFVQFAENRMIYIYGAPHVHIFVFDTFEKNKRIVSIIYFGNTMSYSYRQ